MTSGSIFYPRNPGTNNFASRHAGESDDYAFTLESEPAQPTLLFKSTGRSCNNLITTMGPSDYRNDTVKIQNIHPALLTLIGEEASPWGTAVALFTWHCMYVLDGNRSIIRRVDNQTGFLRSNNCGIHLEIHPCFTPLIFRNSHHFTFI